MIENLEKTILFSSIAHKNQEMMEPDVPYITHVISVAGNVLEAYYNGKEKFDLNLALKIALLHDTIEDTSITYDDVNINFGKEVADGVLALTKDSSLPKEIQLKNSIERIILSSKEAAIVKLADRINNLMIKPNCWSNEKWNNYLEESKFIYENLKKYNSYLANKLEERIKLEN